MISRPDLWFDTLFKCQCSLTSIVYFTLISDTDEIIDFISCCCDVDMLMCWPSPWMRRLNFPTFPKVNVCFFPFLFSVCAQTNTSSFSRLYCLVSLHSLWDEFKG